MLDQQQEDEQPLDVMLVPYDVYRVHPEHAPFLSDASLRREESCRRVVHFPTADWYTFRLPAPAATRHAGESGGEGTRRPT